MYSQCWVWFESALDSQHGHTNTALLANSWMAPCAFDIKLWVNQETDNIPVFCTLLKITCLLIGHKIFSCKDNLFFFRNVVKSGWLLYSASIVSLVSVSVIHAVTKQIYLITFIVLQTQVKKWKMYWKNSTVMANCLNTTLKRSVNHHHHHSSFIHSFIHQGPE